jgi:hypothetical protein
LMMQLKLEFFTLKWFEKKLHTSSKNLFIYVAISCRKREFSFFAQDPNY